MHHRILRTEKKHFEQAPFARPRYPPTIRTTACLDKIHCTWNKKERQRHSSVVTRCTLLCCCWSILGIQIKKISAPLTGTCCSSCLLSLCDPHPSGDAPATLLTNTQLPAFHNMPTHNVRRLHCCRGIAVVGRMRKAPQIGKLLIFRHHRRCLSRSPHQGLSSNH